MIGALNFDLSKLDAAFLQIAGVHVGDGGHLEGVFAGELFHDPVGRAAFADANFLDFEPQGLVDDAVQDQFGLGGIPHKGAEIDGFKETQGPFFPGGVEDGRGRDDGMGAGQGHIEQVGPFHVHRDNGFARFRLPLGDDFFFQAFESRR